MTSLRATANVAKGRHDLKVLILWADDKSTNLGVRALYQGACALIREVFPGVTVDYQSYEDGHAPTRPTIKILLLAHLRRSAAYSAWISGYDLILDTRAGDSFADIYGWRRHALMTLVSLLASRRGVPVVLSPQTIGPFDTALGQAAARLTARRAIAVLARDSASALYARKMLGVEAKASTDVVFALQKPARHNSYDVLLNVSGLLWNTSHHLDNVVYRQLMLDLCRSLTANGRSVTLLAHVLASKGLDDDEGAIRDLNSKLDAPLPVVIPDSLEAVRNHIAGARLLIGARMHACLNSISVGTTAVPLAYSRKFAPLLSDIGWPFVVDLRSKDELLPVVLRTIEEAEKADSLGEVTARSFRAIETAQQQLRKAVTS